MMAGADGSGSFGSSCCDSCCSCCSTPADARADAHHAASVVGQSASVPSPRGVAEEESMDGVPVSKDMAQSDRVGVILSLPSTPPLPLEARDGWIPVAIICNDDDDDDSDDIGISTACGGGAFHRNGEGNGNGDGDCSMFKDSMWTRSGWTHGEGRPPPVVFAAAW